MATPCGCPGAVAPERLPRSNCILPHPAFGVHRLTTNFRAHDRFPPQTKTFPLTPRLTETTIWSMALEQEKQNRIVAAATERFARFGFKKTSIDEIAADAGVGKGTVYLMAESKEDLFYQVVHKELRAWVAECASHIDPRKPADELLLSLTISAFGYLEARPLVKDLLLANYEQMMPMWTGQLADLRAICCKNSEEVLRIGVRQGRFRADLDIPHLARVLQDMLSAGLLYAYRTNTPPMEQLQNTAVCIDLLLHGLLVKT